jgi:hypothetical protein
MPFTKNQLRTIEKKIKEIRGIEEKRKGRYTDKQAKEMRKSIHTVDRILRDEMLRILRNYVV